jgi:hypothetical protein
MKVQIVSQTGTGSTGAIVVNTNTNPCNIGFGVIVASTVEYTIEHTFDDPSTTDLNDEATWFPHPTVFELAVNADGNYAFPVTAIRLTVNSGGGTATLKLVQAGIA